MACVQRSITLNILFFGWVETLEVARPNVKADVISAADVENKTAELTCAVGNGAQVKNAGSKVIRVVAVAEFASSILEEFRSKLSLPTRQASDDKTFTIEKSGGKRIPRAGGTTQ